MENDITREQLITSIQIKMNTLTLASTVVANMIRKNYPKEIAGDTNYLDLENFSIFLSTIKVGLIIDIAENCGELMI